MGPGGPLIALLAGALFGGLAGGTAGGVYTCTVEGDHYVIKYLPEYKYPHHPPPGPVVPVAPGYNHHVHPTSYHYQQHPAYTYYPSK